MSEPRRDGVGDHNVAALHEAIAEARQGQGDCVVTPTRRLSWGEVTDRSRRLAAVLQDAGLGLRGDPADVEPWVSPHDHVALYLVNSPEYLEGMLGAWKARCAPINVNYRYVASELSYLLRDAAVRAVVVGGRFTETLAEVLPELPEVELILQVDDGSDAPPLPGAVAYEAALAAAKPQPPHDLSPHDRYVLYTGGTTGMPKGVLWRQGDFLATCLGVSGTADELVALAQRRGSLRVLPAAPFMHGGANWNALSAWVAGGTVVIQSEPGRLDPADVLTTCQRERVRSLQIVGDPFARPLLDELTRAATAGQPYDLSSLHFLISGGAVLSQPVKDELRAAIPGLRILDVLGSSETGRQATGGADGGAFTPSAAASVLAEDRSRVLDPTERSVGWLAQRGRVPLGYLGDADKTAATFPVVDGVRFAVAGDRVRWTDDGRIELLGRDSVTINTGGEKVYAEEVEHVLTSHPAVHDAVVVGRASPRWGQEIVAVLSARHGAAPPTDGELREHCRARLAGYKVPKAFFWVDDVLRSPAGKADYRWARSVIPG